MRGERGEGAGERDGEGLWEWVVYADERNAEGLQWLQLLDDDGKRVCGVGLRT